MRDRRPCSTPGCRRSAYGRDKCDRCRKAAMSELADKIRRKYKLMKI